LKLQQLIEELEQVRQNKGAKNYRDTSDIVLDALKEIEKFHGEAYTEIGRLKDDIADLKRRKQ
jgi:hypothetical protein